MAQLNLLVGDIPGNADLVIQAACYARDVQRAHAIVFPELTLTGYPPEDLLLRPELVRRVEDALVRISTAVTGIDVILGYPRATADGLFNSAGVIREGKIVAEYDKQFLPNYSVFDEKRYFEPGHEPCIFEIKGVPVAVTICEDIWEEVPAAQVAAAGARLILNLNASPYHYGKAPEREELLQRRAKENGLPILYVNLVGGQDELVFDGGSFVVDAKGELAQRGEYFAKAQMLVEVDATEGVVKRGDVSPQPGEEESIYQALVLGVRDYVA